MCTVTWRHSEREQTGKNSPANEVSSMDRITIDPERCGGRPCIRGLRIRVKDVLELLASGASQQEILEDYPYLEAQDIVAVLLFAAQQADHPILRTAS